MANNALMEADPLVSVGIPTFNRPEGLKRTLDCITQQTYKNIEIIISDNCSHGLEIREILEEYSQKDARITFYIQNTNLGAVRNFKFVLEKASGEYFMWAADDDEWDKDFIKKLMNIRESKKSLFCNFISYNRFHDTQKLITLPISNRNNNVENGFSFLEKLTPNMFYGIHSRETLETIFSDVSSINFDWFDCYFVYKIIIENNYKVHNEVLYKAGTDAATYIFKPYNGKYFEALTYLKSMKTYISSAENLNRDEKKNFNSVLSDSIPAFINMMKTLTPDSDEDKLKILHEMERIHNNALNTVVSRHKKKVKTLLKLFLYKFSPLYRKLVYIESLLERIESQNCDNCKKGEDKSIV